MSDRIDRRSFLPGGRQPGSASPCRGRIGRAPPALQLGGELESTAVTGSHPDGISTATPKPGGQLIFGTEAEEKGFSTTLGHLRHHRHPLRPHRVRSPGHHRLPIGTVQPYLAESIVPNADYTTWTVTMLPNLIFHNGAPLRRSRRGGQLRGPAGVRSSPGRPSPRSATSPSPPAGVVGHHEVPLGPLRLLPAGGIGGQIAFIAEPKWLKPRSQTNPIGTGPFVFQAWDPNDHFTATKNPHYWRSGLSLPRQHHLQAHPRQPAAAQQPQLGCRRHHPHLHRRGHGATPVHYAALAYIDDSPARGRRARHELPAAQPVQIAVRQPEGAPGRGAWPSARPSTPRSSTVGVSPTSNGPFVLGSPFYAPTRLPGSGHHQGQAAGPTGRSRRPASRSA